MFPPQFSRAVVAALVFAALAAARVDADASCAGVMPDPFSSALRVGASGTEVMVAQHLLSRSQYVQPGLESDGIFGNDTQIAVSGFQTGNNLTGCQPGVIDRPTALALLELHTFDGYRDDGKSARSQGYLYKILIPVHRNRSIETNATFLDADNSVLFRFRVRTKGHVADGCGKALAEAWPNFNSTGWGLNMFTSNGMTPTGLTAIDLDEPEGEPKLYGPYPVTRFVQGLQGNAAFLVPHLRDGILIHTGEWPSWSPGQQMPNSAGCVHSWPHNIERVWKTAISGAVNASVHPNPGGSLPYPYKTQGLVSVFQID